MRHKSLLQTIFLLLAAFLTLSYSDDPPDGRTGAPFNGKCSDCHTSNNPNGYNGFAELVGLPDTIQPNTNYPLQINITVTAGNPVRAGFQLVVVDQKNLNAGNLTPINNETGTDFLAGREYLDHRGGKYFGLGPVSWSFNWTSPDSVSCNQLHFYYIINLCNGSGDFGDCSIAFSKSRYFAGGPSLRAFAGTLHHNVCLEDLAGIAEIAGGGGAPPYQYQWSNGMTSAQIGSLATGVYRVTVQDAHTCIEVDSTEISYLDSLSPEIFCPESLYFFEGDTVYYAEPTISDNCALTDPEPVLLSGLPDSVVFPVGIHEQVFQATDTRGNTATCTFTIQIDSLPLEINFPGTEHEIIKVFPNPVRHGAFQLKGLQGSLKSVDLRDMDGKLLRNFSAGHQDEQYSVVDFSVGSYILQIITDDEQVFRFILVKLD